LSPHVCGAGIAFLGFGLSLVIGLWVNNPFNTLVLRSLVVLLVFYIIGYILAALGQKAIQENVDTEIETHQQALAEQQNDQQTPPETSDNVQTENPPPTEVPV
jgi:hypothetical protein